MNPGPIRNGRRLRAAEMEVNLHSIPVHQHPSCGTNRGKAGLWLIAEEAYEAVQSLPIFPRRTEEEVPDVIAAVSQAARGGP